MNIQVILGIVAVLIGFIGYGFYIKGIIAGLVKPHAFTWSIWGILTTIAAIAQVSAGGGPGAWVTAATAVMSFVFAGIGLQKSARIYITKADWVFFAASLLTIPAWLLTGNPVWSVILITIIDAVAFAPTIRKAYLHPATENTTTFALSALKFIIGIAALNHFSLTTVLYPASLVLANGAFVIMVLWREKHIKVDTKACV